MPGPGSRAMPKPTFTKDKRQAKRDQEKAWQEVRRAVMARDSYKCRVCYSTSDVEVHHIRFRSTGGTNESRNLAVLCRVCHAGVHAYRLALEGNADKKLKVTWL